LGRSRTCVVCVGSGPHGPWQSKEVRAAIQEQVEKETVGIIPVLIPGADKAVFKDLPAFLKQSHGFTFSSPGDQETLDRLAASILGKQRAIPLLWYFDDSATMLADFKKRHGSRFDIKTFRNAVDFVEALLHVRPGSASFP